MHLVVAEFDRLAVILRPLPGLCQAALGLDARIAAAL
jgi:hypothetical protein